MTKRDYLHILFLFVVVLFIGLAVLHAVFGAGCKNLVAVVDNEDDFVAALKIRKGLEIAQEGLADADKVSLKVNLKSEFAKKIVLQLDGWLKTEDGKNFLTTEKGREWLKASRKPFYKRWFSTEKINFKKISDGAGNLPEEFLEEVGIWNVDISLLESLEIQNPAINFPINLGHGAMQKGEKHILEIKRLADEGKLGSARRYLKNAGEKQLIASEDAAKIEKFLDYTAKGQIKITSVIHDDSGLVRLAEEAGKNQDVRRDLDHLTQELAKGSLKGAGIGLGHISGTDIFYMRTRNGARLFLHRVGDGYEIVGKSSKANENSVIARLIKLYSKQK